MESQGATCKVEMASPTSTTATIRAEKQERKMKSLSLWKRNPLLYIAQTVFFVVFFYGACLGMNFLQFGIGMPLALLHRGLYLKFMRLTQRMYAAIFWITTAMSSPLQIVLTGAHKELQNDKESPIAPIIANHQIYSDWWYIWLMGIYKNTWHGEIKIMLKDISWFPIFGWGMWCFEYIFLSRKWQVDRPRIVNALTRAKKDDNPMWLLLFPEGTVIDDESKLRSAKYAEKAGITDFKAKYVLMPRCTGLYHTLRCLDEKTEYLYDFTISFSGLDSSTIPFDRYPIDKVFLEGGGPQTVHIHVDRFKLSEIPGLCSMLNTPYQPDEATPVAFEVWMRKRFMEKDAMLEKFHLDSSFPDAGEGNREVLMPAIRTQKTIASAIVWTMFGLAILLSRHYIF